MKLRYAALFLASISLIATGCGSDESKEPEKKDAKPKSKAQVAIDEDVSNKQQAVERAEKEYEKAQDDVGACRNLAMSYIALASPASSPDPKTPVELPKDRDKNLDKAVSTLEECAKDDPKDRDVKQMLASTYMATNKYDEAAPLLKQLAGSAKGPERPNAYYAWGLAASNAQDYDAAIEAWQTFVQLSPPKDPRVAQVRQSIKALRAAKAAPAPKAAASETPSDAAPGDDAEGDDSGDDAGSDDEGTDEG